MPGLITEVEVVMMGLLKAAPSAEHVMLRLYAEALAVDEQEERSFEDFTGMEPGLRQQAWNHRNNRFCRWPGGNPDGGSLTEMIYRGAALLDWSERHYSTTFYHAVDRAKLRLGEALARYRAHGRHANIVMHPEAGMIGLCKAGGGCVWPVAETLAYVRSLEVAYQNELEFRSPWPMVDTLDAVRAQMFPDPETGV